MAKTNVRREPDDQRPLPRGIQSTSYHAHQADLRVVTRLSNIRDNMEDYQVNYPAAVEVRDQLGLVKWEKLERYRMSILNFSEHMRRLDREELEVPREELDVFVPAMKKFIQCVCGQRALEYFEETHEELDAILGERACKFYGMQGTGPMAHFMRWFHQRPTLWFIYNLYFPIFNPTENPRPGISKKGRMRWHQQMDWAIWTLEHPDEGQVYGYEPSAEGVIWNRALVEVFQKIRRAFRPQDN